MPSQAKIPMWSRNPAKMKPEVGAEMSLFGGNISGKVTAVTRPTSVVCDWRAPTWPAGPSLQSFPPFPHCSFAKYHYHRLLRLPRNDARARFELDDAHTPPFRRPRRERRGGCMSLSLFTPPPPTCPNF